MLLVKGKPRKKGIYTPVAAFGTIPTVGTIFWATEGDSRTIGGQGTPPTTPPLTLAINSGSVPWVTGYSNPAQGGATLNGSGATVYSRQTADDNLITLNPGYANYVISILIGVNDFGVDGISTSTYLSQLAAWGDARRTAGWKVIMCTELPAYTGSQATSYSAWRSTVNATIKTWIGVHCNAVCDLAADPNIGQDGDQANTTYFVPDNLHPNTAGSTIMSTIMMAALGTLPMSSDNDLVLSTLTTWSPSLKHANITLTNSNRTAASSSPGSFFACMSVNSHVTGKRYAELEIATDPQAVIGPDEFYQPGFLRLYDAVSCAHPGFPGLYPYTDYHGQNLEDALGNDWAGDFFNTGTGTAFTLAHAIFATFVAGDVIMYAIDFDGFNYWMGKNGTWSSGDPGLGTLPNVTGIKHLRMGLGVSILSTGTVTLPSSFHYTVPTGFSPF
jgi:lysophospholipase L1-like esterase